jgi:hypothetical protein
MRLNIVKSAMDKNEKLIGDIQSTNVREIKSSRQNFLLNIDVCAVGRFPTINRCVSHVYQSRLRQVKHGIHKLGKKSLMPTVVQYALAVEKIITSFLPLTTSMAEAKSTVGNLVAVGSKSTLGSSVWAIQQGIEFSVQTATIRMGSLATAHTSET